MATVTLEHVSYIYEPGTPFEIKALDDVSIDIENNCMTGIIGHTGSGKSTLVQMFNGLLKPSSGRILLDGKDIFPAVVSHFYIMISLVILEKNVVFGTVLLYK
mgnify:CR=1 FL=1